MQLRGTLGTANQVVPVIDRMFLIFLNYTHVNVLYLKKPIGARCHSELILVCFSINSFL